MKGPVCKCNSCWAGRYDVVCCCVKHPGEDCPVKDCKDYRGTPEPTGKEGNDP